MATFTAQTDSVEGRMMWLGRAVGLAFLIFALRLIYVQVIQHDYYVGLAKHNQITRLTVFPERGTILARDGADGTAPLVMNETVYTVFADPHEVKDIQKVKDTLQRIAGGEIVSSSLPFLSDTARRYVVLARQVTRQQAEMIQKEDLAGVGLQKGTRRVYPEGQLASQLLGYVNNDGEGQYGVEGALNARLAGKNGLLQSVADVRRIPLTIAGDTIDIPAVNGENIVLSVDRNIQFQLEQTLAAHATKVKAEHASAIIMDPTTGQIVAMANVPTYDPNEYSKVTNYSLFQNRVTDNAYEPGSVMKTLTVAAGLNEKVIAPNTTYNNGAGCTIVDDAKICNVLRNVPTNPTMQQLLTYSLNTGAVSVLRSLGGGSITKVSREKLYSYFADHYRMGKITGIEQAGETDGVLYSPQEQEGNAVRYANMTFGQGMQVTMVQVASAFSSIMNGGTYYKPTLVYGVQKSDGTFVKQTPIVVERGVIGSEYSAEMREMVWHSRYDNNGRSVDPAGYRIGGKSGTAQTIDPKTGKYTADRTIGSYLGYVGGSTPEYVIMVRMDFAEGGTYGGSAEANATFGDMAHWLIHYAGTTPN